MSTLVFTQTEGGTAAVTVSGNIVYGTDFHTERLNHHTLGIVDGTEVIYDSGPTKLYGVILLKNMSGTDKGNMLSWLRSSIIFSKYKFTISALSGVDWGKGANTAVTNARYAGENTTKGIFEYMPPGIYTMTFPYMAVL